MGTALKLSPRNRRRIEEMVERLIAVLDTVDGDPDLEPTSGSVECYDQEVSWAWTPRQFIQTKARGRVALVEIEDGARSEDKEPSLGSLEQIDQSYWGNDPNYQPDLEWQCEDEGFDSDSEAEPADEWRVVPHQEDQTRPALVTPYLAG